MCRVTGLGRRRSRGLTADADSQARRPCKGVTSPTRLTSPSPPQILFHPRHPQPSADCPPVPPQSSTRRWQSLPEFHTYTLPSLSLSSRGVSTESRTLGRRAPRYLRGLKGRRFPSPSTQSDRRTPPRPNPKAAGGPTHTKGESDRATHQSLRLKPEDSSRPVRPALIHALPSHGREP